MSSQPKRTEFEIAPGIKNSYWIKLKLTSSSSKFKWLRAVCIFQRRLGRFLRPVDELVKSSDKKIALYSGFAIIALDCLLIETLQSFRRGRPNPIRANDRLTRKMFVEFLTQRTSFNKYFDASNPTLAELFFDHFRNGILHQGEIKSSGLVRIDTPKMIMPTDDGKSIVVNRLLFHQALVDEVECYGKELIDSNDVTLRDNFIRKMNEICRIGSP